MELVIDGQDLVALDTIAIDPDSDLVIDLHILMPHRK
jgi:hypothetical protein